MPNETACLLGQAVSLPPIHERGDAGKTRSKYEMSVNPSLQTVSANVELR